MSLITRQGKGSKLTIEELDGNLTYLEGLVSLYKKTVSSNIDWSEASMQEIEINEKTNFDFTGATTGQTLSLILDAKKAALITWPESIQWTTDINQLDLNYTISYTDVGTGFNGPVTSIAIQDDGKVLIGGFFTEYNGVSANCIIRLNTDGSIDTSFDAGIGFIFNDYVKSIEIQDDGKILVGGLFSSYNGVSANSLIRLNTDGNIDTSFDTGTGFRAQWGGGEINSIVIQPDGKILVGGYITEYNGISINTLVRLNSDGNLDNTFDIGTEFNSVVYSIAIQDDGKILIGFDGITLDNDYTIYQFVRVNPDGSEDLTISLNLLDYVNSIAIQDDGKILIGGQFSSYNGVSANCLIRVNSDGSVDESFDIGTGVDGIVWSVAIQDDGKILVGGYITGYNGVSANMVIRLNSDGSRDTLFDTKFDINLTNALFVIKTKLNNIYLGFFFNHTSDYTIIMPSLNYEQAYEICNFYYNGTYYIGESTI